MNERIKALAEQLGADDVKLPHGYRYALVGEENIQKFAELIIRECLKVSDELQSQYRIRRTNAVDFDEKTIYAEGEAACDILKYKIKKYFEVGQ